MYTVNVQSDLLSEFWFQSENTRRYARAYNSWQKYKRILYSKESQILYFESWCYFRKKITRTKNFWKAFVYFEGVFFHQKLLVPRKYKLLRSEKSAFEQFFVLIFSRNKKLAAALARLSHAILALFGSCKTSLQKSRYRSTVNSPNFGRCVLWGGTEFKKSKIDSCPHGFPLLGSWGFKNAKFLSSGWTFLPA